MEYHLVAPLLRMGFGIEALSAYMTAVHVALIEEINRIEAALHELERLLRAKEQQWEASLIVLSLHFQDIGIVPLGTVFAQYAEGVARSIQQIGWLKSRLLPCWQGRATALLPLRELTGLQVAVCRNKKRFSFECRFICWFFRRS